MIGEKLRMMTNMSDLFERSNLDLVSILRDNNDLIFLAGAGISMDPPASLPSARQMMDAIIEYGAPTTVKINLLQISALRYEYLIEIFHTYYDPAFKLMDFFDLATRPNALHLYLAHKLEKGNWILTTNFDYLIEHACGISNPTFQVVITPQDFKTFKDPRKWYEKGTLLLYKLHGSTKNVKTGAITKDTLVTTISSLGKFKEGDVFSVEVWKRELFENIGKGRTLIVMGYSGGDDFDIVPMLSRIPGLKRIIWVEHNPSIGGNYVCWRLKQRSPGSFSFKTREDELLHLLQSQSSSPCPEILKAETNANQLIRQVFPPAETVTAEPINQYAPSQWIAQNFLSTSFESREIFAAVIFQNYGRFQDALRHFSSLHAFYQKNKDDKNIGLMLVNMGHNYRYLNQFDAAQDCYQKAISYLEKNNQFEELSWTSANLGLIYRQKGLIDKALESNEKAHSVFQKTNNQLGIANTALAIGYLMRDLGKLDKALQFMKEALPIYETLGDLTNQAWTYANMGVVFAGKKEFKHAIELYEKALSIFKKLGNVDGIKNTEQALAGLKQK